MCVKLTKLHTTKCSFFPTVIELFYWIKTWYSSETALVENATQPQAVYNDNAVKIKPKWVTQLAEYNTSGVHYLEKPSNSAVSRAFFLGWSEGTSTSKAVACAVISIAGSVTTQPTAQTTTSASTWSKRERKKDREGEKKTATTAIEINYRKAREMHRLEQSDIPMQPEMVRPLPLCSSSVKTWIKRETPPKQTCSLRSSPPPSSSFLQCKTTQYHHGPFPSYDLGWRGWGGGLQYRARGPPEDSKRRQTGPHFMQGWFSLETVKRSILLEVQGPPTVQY